jgi:hypothetical protein
VVSAYYQLHRGLSDTRWGHASRKHRQTGGIHPKAKEGHTMNTQFWLELLILALRIVSAGLAD